MHRIHKRQIRIPKQRKPPSNILHSISLILKLPLQRHKARPPLPDQPTYIRVQQSPTLQSNQPHQHTLPPVPFHAETYVRRSPHSLGIHMPTISPLRLCRYSLQKRAPGSKRRCGGAVGRLVDLLQVDKVREGNRSPVRDARPKHYALSSSLLQVWGGLALARY